MLETKWEIDDAEGRGWKYETSYNLFTTQKTNILEQKLREFLSKSEKTNGEIYKFTLQNGFLTKKTTEIFKNW